MCTAMVGQARGQGVWGLSPSRKGAQTRGNPQGAGSREGPSPRPGSFSQRPEVTVPCLEFHVESQNSGLIEAEGVMVTRLGAPAGREAVHGHTLHRAEKGALETCSMAQRS